MCSAGFNPSHASLEQGAALTSDPSKVFVREKGIAAKMAIQNIDTDMIIPKQVSPRMDHFECGSVTVNAYFVIFLFYTIHKPQYISSPQHYSAAAHINTII